MIFIKIDSDNVVDMVHYMPFDPEQGLGKTQSELEAIGVFVDNIPTPLNNGMVPLMKYDPVNKVVFYEYNPSPKTDIEIQKDQIQNLQSQNAQMLLALVNGGLI